MTAQPVMTIERDAFETRADVYRDMIDTGYWPTTYLSTASPELPLHWHDGNIIGYLLEGETYLLNEKGEECRLSSGSKLIIPAGALHAEGEVTEPVTYIVTLEQNDNFFHALRMLDPQTYPDPQNLAPDPELAAALMPG